MNAHGTVAVLFFSRMREAMGTDEVRTRLPAADMTAASLLDHLCADDPARAANIAGLTIRAAINHVMAPLDSPVQAGDEVAYFPPVTGG